MNAGDSLPVGQHDIEIQRNREAWARKPLLRAVYRSFHELLAAQIDRTVPGAIVELGSGMGAIKETIPDCVTTDLFPNPWLDRRENAYRLSFGDSSVSNLILFDVWHHLRYPGTALREFHRVVAPKGRVILFEPAISAAGRGVYGLFHHEPLGMGSRLAWEAPAGFSAENADYFAAQGSATRLFWRGEAGDRLAGWELCAVRPVAAFDYWAAGGFSRRQIGGPRLLPLWRKLNRAADRCPSWFAARLLVVLARRDFSP